MVTSPTVRPPQQSRSRKTLNRILRAALELLEERGVEGVTVQDVVKRSGTSVGSFYHRFGTKDDLLAYLERRVWEDALERWSALWREEAPEEGAAAPSLRSVLARGVEALVGAHQAGLRVAAALSSPGTPVGEGALDGEAARAFRDRVIRDLESALEAYASEVAHPDPRVALQVVYPLLVGCLRELEAERTPDGEPALDRRLLTRELTRVLVGYLGTGPAGEGPHPSRDSSADPDDDESVDPFEIWS